MISLNNITALYVSQNNGNDDFNGFYTKHDIQNNGPFKTLEKAINIKDKKERYSFIYDEVCKFLDNEYITKNLCDFKDNVCAYYRSINEFDHKNGCCFSAKRGGFCNNLDLDHCKISSISCLGAVLSLICI